MRSNAMKLTQIKITITLMILSLFMANKAAKAEEITVERVAVIVYELTVYDQGKPLFFDVYGSMDECLAVAKGFEDYTCIPVIKEFAQ